jgi:hypothetical protein
MIEFKYDTRYSIHIKFPQDLEFQVVQLAAEIPGGAAIAILHDFSHHRSFVGSVGFFPSPRATGRLSPKMNS